jgi:hypothetical protein
LELWVPDTVREEPELSVASVVHGFYDKDSRSG